ncbi:Serine/threonine-protein kinase polo [Gryllus bimaculatus]|nr:Serine/threonine-protein kinase polo [Gryllus bimaculatus]
MNEPRPVMFVYAVRVLYELPGVAYVAETIAREISIHRNLVHKNVVRLHHFFEDNANAYIVLENCSRKSLFHVLKHRYSVTEPEARYYLRQLVEGVKYIHSQKVIHRDLKPGNMLLSEDMVVKLGDFGLATLVDGNKKVSICGTPNYIAPEVLNKLSYSYEADVWAIGCILYAMLVGQPPFETASLKETYSRIVNNKYTIPLTVSENGRKLIRQLLQPLPENRILVEKINGHDFFKNVYTPDTLSPLCCYTAPAFNTVLLNRHMAEGLTPVDMTSSGSAKVGCNTASTTKHVTQKNALLAKITFKQKISSVLCPDKIGRKKENNALALYHIVVGCLRSMPLPSENSTPVNPNPVTCFLIFVSKWIDYSNKYGFGFQLSDKSVGVLFNDNTRISFNPDRSQVEFHDVNGKVTAHPNHSVPEPLHQRLAVLEYFLHYMQENLTDGGYVSLRSNEKHRSPILQMKRWVRTNTAIIMELSNGTLQINFFKDHTKIIISAGKHGYLVTYINGERQSCSYWLHQIAQVGCEKNISNRLKFAAAVLREFAELDGEML